MTRNNLKDKAYALIKEKITNCEYAPGQFLVEAELMEEVGASRTPIREALNKLEQENLLRIMPKRGVVVSDITMATVNEIYEIRQLIEPYIIRSYAASIPINVLKKEREKISGNFPPENISTFYEVDNDLHQLLINSSHNSYIVALMRQIYTQNHRLRIISGQKVERRLEESRNEHIEVFDLLIGGDIEGAAKAMNNHLINSKFAAVNAMLSGKSWNVNM